MRGKYVLLTLRTAADELPRRRHQGRHTIEPIVDERNAASASRRLPLIEDILKISLDCRS